MKKSRCPDSSPSDVRCTADSSHTPAGREPGGPCRAGPQAKRTRHLPRGSTAGLPRISPETRPLNTRFLQAKPQPSFRPLFSGWTESGLLNLSLRSHPSPVRHRVDLLDPPLATRPAVPVVTAPFLVSNLNSVSFLKTSVARAALRHA